MSVEGTRFTIPELQGALAPAASPDPFPVLRTEVQALTAPAQLETVIAALHLDDDPEFNAALRPKTLLDRVKGAFGALTTPLLASGPQAEVPPNDEQVVAAVTRALTVFQDNRSLVISVAFTSHDPLLSAKFVNTLISSYVQSRARHDANANRGANAVMEQRIDQVRGDLEAIEKQMNTLRSSNTLVALPAGSVGQQQVQELTTAAQQATLARTQLEETYNRAVAALKAGSSDQIAAVLNSPTISQLRDQEAAAARRMAQLSTYYGSGYPGIRSAQAAVSTARRQIAEEAARIVASLGEQLRSARAQEQSVLAQLDQARHTSIAGENARAQLDQLQQEETTRRALYQTLLEREQQTAAEPANTETPDVRVLSPAQPPATPSGPNSKLAALMGASGGALLGCLLALTRMNSVRGFESEDDVTALTGMPVVATLPLKMMRAGQGLLDSRGAVADGPEVDALRMARERLRFVGRTGVPRCVVFAPATPEAAGAAAPVTAAFARAAAADGERVLLVEGDLHAPALARLLGLRNVAGGLQKALAVGDVAGTDWRDAVLADRQPGLDLLLAEGRLADAHALLSGVAFQNLLVEARADYELVVVSAPLPAVSDTVALVQRADAAVLVLDGRSDQNAVHEASSRLVNMARTPLVAVLLSRA
jgi:uncharacterized protein involved in exopolysaccharide biosynthesis/Mrp family chromosome partitioning ATPase